MIIKSISSSEARSSFYSILREVVDDAVPVVIRQRGKQNAVILSEDEYNSLVETVYLSSGKNGERLRESKEQMECGECRVISLDEIKSMGQ
ncbi:MAG: type II toxin-antitoxin system Phd/YefM family antitoxin [Akkermansia sp.]